MSDDKIRIDWDDLNKPQVDTALDQERRLKAAGDHYHQRQQYSSATQTDSGGGEEYGRLTPAGPVAGIAGPAAGGMSSFLYRSVVYMSAAGAAGALVGWVVTEALQDSLSSSMGSVALFFAIVGGLLGLFLGSIEGLVSGQQSEAIRNGGIALMLGVLGGGLGGLFGQTLYGGVAMGPQTVALVLDTSDSMEGQALRELKESSTRFVDNGSRHSMSFSLVSFASSAQTISQVEKNSQAIIAQIESLSTNGNTNMADGLRKGWDTIASVTGEKTLVLFSDGLPTPNNFSQSELLKLVEQELTKRGYTMSQVKQMSSSEQQKLLNDIKGPVLKEISAVPAAEAVAEADKVRAAGGKILAIGTGEADKEFLAKIAGGSSRVLFAANGDISSAFRQAEQMLFREAKAAPGTEQVSGARVGSRAAGWGLVGLAIGVAQGLGTRSRKKIINGLIGGLIGGVIGGILFDPISSILQSGALSRAVALCVIGLLTGLLIGIVENLMKDAWLQVTSGPLTGKQFVIYKNPTLFGSSPKADIYLFKDASIEPQHAVLSITPQGYFIQDMGSRAGTFVNQQRVTRRRLSSGDVVQIGQYTFHYSERAKAATPAYAGA